MTESHSQPRRQARSPLLVALAVASVVSLGCRAKKADDEKRDKDEDKPSAPTETKPAESGAGSLGMMSALMAGQATAPGPYDELDESPSFDSSAPHVGVVEVSGTVAELSGFSLREGFEGIEMLALVEGLYEVLGQKQVTSLLVRFGNLDIGPGFAEELHSEFLALRSAHPEKPIACHAEAVSTYTYWVMTACTSITLAAGGELSIPGVAAVPMHLKGLLDRLGVRADFLHIGDYKGAAEPLTLDRPSRQSQETTAMILDQAFSGLIDAIVAGRSLKRAEVEAHIDTAIFQAEAAATAKLIDRVAAFHELRGDNWKVFSVTGDDDPTQKIFELIGLRPIARPSGDRVALVYAVGSVVDGLGGTGGARSEIASRRLVAALDALSRDDDVKAVVLRVSSPGGSALASEVIWGAIERLRKSRPVVVSMGSVAASGGYYISAPATKIYANKNTLTGSIGVVGGKIATSGGLDKLGIKTFPTGRGRHALLFASPEPWSKAERDVVRASMQAVYDQFSGRVRQSRGDIDDSLMQGRVWTGEKALEHKLVDEIGGLRSAIDHARKIAGVAPDSALEIYPPEPTLKDMLSSLGVSSGQTIALEILAKLEPRVARVVRQAISLALGFRQSSIQAALILPVVL